MGKSEKNNIDIFNTETSSPSLPTAFRGFKKSEVIKFIDDIIKQSEISTLALSETVTQLTEDCNIAEKDKQILLEQTKELCEKLEASEKECLSMASRIQYAEDAAEQYKSKLFSGEQEKSLMKAHIVKIEDELDNSNSKIEELVKLYKINNLLEDSSKYVDRDNSRSRLIEAEKSRVILQKQELVTASQKVEKNLGVLERDIVEIEDRLISAYETIHHTQGTVQSAILTAKQNFVEAEPSFKYEDRFNANDFEQAEKVEKYELPKYELPQSQIHRNTNCYESARIKRKDISRPVDLSAQKNQGPKNLSDILLEKLNKILG